MKQGSLPGMEIVDIRVRVPKSARDKLNVIAAIRKTSVNSLLSKAIDEILSRSEELKKLDM